MSTSTSNASPLSVRWATAVSAGTCVTVAGLAAAILAPSAPFDDIGRVLMLVVGPGMLGLIVDRWRASSRAGRRGAGGSAAGWIVLATLSGLIIEVGVGTLHGKARAAENSRAWKKAYQVTHQRIAALRKTVTEPSADTKTASLQSLIAKYQATFRPSRAFKELISRRLKSEGQSIDIRELRALMQLGPKATAVLAKTYTLRRLAALRIPGTKHVDVSEARRLHEDLSRLQCAECMKSLAAHIGRELAARLETLEPPVLTDALLLSMLLPTLDDSSARLRRRISPRALRDTGAIKTLDDLVARYWRVGELGLPLPITQRLTSRINQLTVEALRGTVTAKRRAEILRLFRRADVAASKELEPLLTR